MLWLVHFRVMHSVANGVIHCLGLDTSIISLQSKLESVVLEVSNLALIFMSAYYPFVSPFCLSCLVWWLSSHLHPFGFLCWGILFTTEKGDTSSEVVSWWGGFSGLFSAGSLLRAETSSTAIEEGLLLWGGNVLMDMEIFSVRCHSWVEKHKPLRGESLIVDGGRYCLRAEVSFPGPMLS